MKLLRLLVACIALIPFFVQASDYAKEQRWADQIVDAILDGEPVWIKNRDKKFLGIYTETEQDKHKAAIIMHGTGVHPDWQQVVQPLRVGLTEHGWHTLSIQMPILANDAEFFKYAPLFDEVAPRIEAAIKLLKSKGVKQIVLIGHSLGASMGAYYLSKPHQMVDGFIGIGIASISKHPRMNSIKAIENIKQTPMLDLYGSEDLQDIVDDAPKRATAAKKAGNQNYKQQTVKNANHMFDDSNDELIETVADWLNKL